MRSIARQSAKRIVERALVAGGVASVGRAVRRHSAAVLAYHNIVPDDAARIGDTSLHLSRSAFAGQLHALQARFDVVPVSELLHEPSWQRRRPRVAITFDDAYQGAVTLGVEELRRLGLPATVFVAPALLGQPAFWWDVLADSVRGEVEPGLRDRVLTELRGRASVALAERRDRDDGALTAFHRPASVSQVVEALHGHPGLTLGAHSWSHPNLAVLSDAELANELELPLQWMASMTDRWLPIIAYPYGRATPRVERAAAERGYVAGWRATGGWMRSMPRQRLDCPRVTVPAGVSSDGFALLVAGIR